MKQNKAKHSLIIIIIGYFLANCAESIVGPLYPIEAAKRQISEDIIGLIFSAHSIVAFISSLMLGQIMNNQRIILQMSGLIGFGFVILIQDETTFIILSTISRILEGIGYSLFCLPIFALIPNLFQNNFEEKVAYLESSGSVGLCLGYILGSGLYAIGGYYLPFLFNALALFILSLIIQKYINIETTNDIIDSDSNSLQKQINIINNQEIKENISYFNMFLKKSILLTSIANIFPTIVLLYFEPTFAIYLDQTFQIGQDQSGLYFFITTFVYIICSTIVGYYMNHLNKKLLILTGLVGFFIVCVLIGPDPILGLYPNIWIIIISLVLLGMFEAIIYPPMMPEAMENLKENYPQLSDEQISDYGSTIYNSTYILGEFIGPILGGTLAESFSFPRATTYLGLVCISYSFAYLLFAIILKSKKIINIKKIQNNILLQCEIITSDEL